MQALTLDDHADLEKRQWIESFTYHLDQVPPLMETMGILATPTIAATRTDEIKITGGGYIDNIPVTDQGAATNAHFLWAMLVEYTKAATEWLNLDREKPEHPPLAHNARQWATPTVNPDPVKAHAQALETIAWLIDRAEQICHLEQLEEYREALFTEIRRAKARYRGAGTPRRAKPRPCSVCGEHAVLIDWADSAEPDGQARPIGRCRTCGETYT